MSNGAANPIRALTRAPATSARIRLAVFAPGLNRRASAKITGSNSINLFLMALSRLFLIFARFPATTGGLCGITSIARRENGRAFKVASVNSRFKMIAAGADVAV